MQGVYPLPRLVMLRKDASVKKPDDAAQIAMFVRVDASKTVSSGDLWRRLAAHQAISPGATMTVLNHDHDPGFFVRAAAFERFGVASRKCRKAQVRLGLIHKAG